MSKYKVTIDFAKAFQDCGILYSYDGSTYSSIGSGEASRDVVEAAVQLSSSWKPASTLVNAVVALDAASSQRASFVLYASGIQALYPAASMPSLGRFVVSKACRVLAPNRTDGSLQGVFLDENDTSNYSVVLDAYLTDALQAFLDSAPVKNHVLAAAAAYNSQSLVNYPVASEIFKCSPEDASLQLQVQLDVIIEYTLEDSGNTRKLALFNEPILITGGQTADLVNAGMRFPHLPCLSSYVSDAASLRTYATWASHAPEYSFLAFDGIAATYWATSAKYCPEYVDTDTYSILRGPLDDGSKALYGDWLQISGTKWFQATHLHLTSSNISRVALLGQANEDTWELMGAMHVGGPVADIGLTYSSATQPFKTFRLVVSATQTGDATGRVYAAHLRGRTVGDPAHIAADLVIQAAVVLPARHAFIQGTSGELVMVWSNEASQMHDLTRITSSSLFGRRITSAVCEDGYAACLDDQGMVHVWPLGDICGMAFDDRIDARGNFAQLKVDSNASVRFAQVACGANCAFARENGTGRVWGTHFDKVQELHMLVGPDARPGTLVPLSITGVAALSQSVGSNHMLAVDMSGNVLAWGSNSNGQLGVPTNACLSAPPGEAVKASVPAPIHIVFVCAGNEVSYAVDSEGHVYSWGSSRSGRLGDGAAHDSSGWRDRPMDISLIPGSSLSGERVTFVTCNEWAAIALDVGGRLHAWGKNVFGVIGANVDHAELPMCISKMDGSSLVDRWITSVSMSGTQAAAVDIEGVMHVWGGGALLPHRVSGLNTASVFPSAPKPSLSRYTQSHRDYGALTFEFSASSTGTNGAPQYAFGSLQTGRAWTSSPDSYDATSGLYVGSSVTECLDGTSIRGEWVQVVCSGASVAARTMLLDGVGGDSTGAGIDAFVLVGLPAGQASSMTSTAWVPIVARYDIHGSSGSLCVHIPDHSETFAALRCIVQRTWNDSGMTHASIHACKVYGVVTSSVVTNGITCSASSNTANAPYALSGNVQIMAIPEWSGGVPYTDALPRTQLDNGQTLIGEWVQIATPEPAYPHLVRLSLGSSGGTAVIVGSPDGESRWLRLGQTTMPPGQGVSNTVDVGPLTSTQTPLHAVRVVVTSLAGPSSGTATVAGMTIIGSRDSITSWSGTSWASVIRGAEPIAAVVDGSGGYVAAVASVKDASGAVFGESYKTGCRVGDALVSLYSNNGAPAWIAALSGGSPLCTHQFRDCTMAGGIVVAVGSTGNATCIVKHPDGSSFASFPRTQAANNPLIVTYAADASGRVRWVVGLCGNVNFTDEAGSGHSGPYASLVECVSGIVLVAGAFAGRLTDRSSPSNVLFASDDGTSARGFLLALNASDGSPRWARMQGTGVHGDVYPRAMCADTQRCLLCTHAKHESCQAIHRYDPSGKLTWVTDATGVMAMACSGASQLDDAPFYTLSYLIGAKYNYDNTGPNAADIVVLEKRSDASGRVTWAALSTGMRPIGVIATEDGGAVMQANCISEVVSAAFDATSNPRKLQLRHFGGILIKFSAAGMIQWVSKMNGMMSDGVRCGGSSVGQMLPVIALPADVSSSFQIYGPDESPCVSVSNVPFGGAILCSVPFGMNTSSFADRLPDPGPIRQVYSEALPELKQGTITSVTYSYGTYVLVADTYGRVYAWGSSQPYSSNLTTPAGYSYVYTPILLSSFGSLVGAYVTSVATGMLHALALDASGRIHAWGNNSRGQIGTGSTKNVDYPTVIGAGSLAIARRQGAGVVSVHAGFLFSAALMSDGSVHMWGDNGRGQLGNGYATPGYSSRPVRTSSYGSLQGALVKQLSAGFNHMLALDAANIVHAWGENGMNQVGNNDHSTSPKPVDTPVNISKLGTLSLQGVTVVQVVASQMNSFAIDSNGSVHAWGMAGNYMLGRINTQSPAYIPEMISKTGQDRSKIAMLTYGTVSHMLALSTQGAVYVWGTYPFYQLGINGTSYSEPYDVTDFIPAAIKNSGIAAMCGSSNTTFVLTKTGRLFVAGARSVQTSATVTQSVTSEFTEVVFGGANF